MQRHNSERFYLWAFGVVLLLAACAFRPALAQAFVCTSSSAHCDQGQAFAEAKGAPAALCAARSAAIGVPLTGQEFSFTEVSAGPTTRRYDVVTKCLTSTGGTNATFSTSFFYDTAKTCLERPEQTNWQPSSQNVCYQGCSYGMYQDPVTQQVYFSTFDDDTNQGFGLCTTGAVPIPDRDHDGEPDATDEFPDDPGEQADADGDGIGDNADFSPDDPDDGKDGEGEEDGDDEGDNESSGGGTCDAPPSCSGDGIQCNLLFQAWKTRCAAEATAVNTDGLGEGAPGSGDGPGTVAGGTSCAQAYVCQGGDPKLCASLNEQHQIRCSLAQDGEGDDDWGEELPVSDAFGVASPTDGFSFDDSGWLGGGDCPAVIPGVDAGDVDLEPLCNGASVLGAYVLILMYLHGIYILGSAITRNS